MEIASLADRQKLVTTPAFRAFGVGQSMPVLKLAANKAFWQLSRTVVEDFGEDAGFSLDAHPNLFLTLNAVISHVSKCSPDECFDIIAQRLAMNNDDAARARELLEMDEAVEGIVCALPEGGAASPRG
jgi:hypothetical protein